MIASLHHSALFLANRRAQLQRAATAVRAPTGTRGYPTPVKVPGESADPPSRDTTTPAGVGETPIKQQFVRREVSVLDLPVGSLNENSWKHGIRELNIAASKRTPVGSKEAWDILDRLVEERGGELHTADSRLKISHLASVIYSWYQAPCQLTAREALQKLDRYRTKVPDLYPDNRCYNMILDAAIKMREKDAHIMGEEILQTLMDNRHDNPYARPNVINFNTAINALAKSGVPDAHLRAEVLLKQMKTLAAEGWTDVQPNKVTYASVIAAWGESGLVDAPKRAEELLQESVAPDERVFNAVLNVWAKSDSPVAADRSFQIFRHMQHLAKAKDFDVSILGYTYAIVLLAFAKRGRAKEAEGVLQELINAYNETKNPELRPNRFHFTTLIDAYARSKGEDSATKAEELLYKMEDYAKQTDNLEAMPSTVTYSSVLHAWAKSDGRDVAARGEALMERLLDKYKSGDETKKPDARCYTMLLDCYAKSRSREAAIKAEQTLQQMHNMYRNGEMQLKPHVQAYAIVLDAWSKSGAKDAPDRAEALLAEMQRLASEDGLDTHPNMYCYSTVLTTWARSGRVEAVGRAEELMKKMNKEAREGGESEMPSIKAYGALLDCYARFFRPQEADIILRKLCTNFLAGKSTVKPNMVCFRIVLKAWSVSRNSYAPSKAVAILELMKAIELKPDTFIYNIIIQAWAKSNDPLCGQKAEACLLEMNTEFKGNGTKCQPDKTTYTAVMNALHRGNLPNTVERARVVLDEMKAGDKSSRPTTQIYQTFLFCIARSNHEDKVQMALDVLAEMEEQDMKVTTRIFNGVLEACALSHPFGRSKREHAFQIAVKIFERIKMEKSPDEFTFGLFFLAAAGLNKDAEVEQAFRLCSELGFQGNKKILEILRRSSPHLFPILYPNNKIS